jgi:hypothetical protein
VRGCKKGGTVVVVCAKDNKDNKYKKKKKVIAGRVYAIFAIDVALREREKGGGRFCSMCWNIRASATA